MKEHVRSGQAWVVLWTTPAGRRLCHHRRGPPTGCIDTEGPCRNYCLPITRGIIALKQPPLKRSLAQLYPAQPTPSGLVHITARTQRSRPRPITISPDLSWPGGIAKTLRPGFYPTWLIPPSPFPACDAQPNSYMHAVSPIRPVQPRHIPALTFQFTQF